jgi:hypothetical protein
VWAFVCNELEEYDGGPLDIYLVRKGWADLTDQTPHLQSIYFFRRKGLSRGLDMLTRQPSTHSRKDEQVTAARIKLDEACSEKRSLKIKVTIKVHARVLYTRMADHLHISLILSS